MAFDQVSTCVSVFINVSLLRHGNDQIFRRNFILNFKLNETGRQRRFHCMLSVTLILVFFYIISEDVLFTLDF